MFKSLQKVILFNRGYPEIGWVIDGRIVSPVWGGFVRVSRHYREAADGRGSDVRIHHVQPYSDELWAACEMWTVRSVEHREALDQLAKGKIAPALRQMEMAI